MKKLLLKNFRCFSTEKIEFDNYTALVGANNAGKSAVLAAIDIFFRANPKSIPITRDDFYKRQDGDIEISLTFSDLTEIEIADFDHYHRGNELTFFIRSTLKEGLVQSSLHGNRFANAEFAPFFTMKTAKEKRAFYEKLDPNYGLSPWRSESLAEEALRKFEDQNPTLNSHIPSNANAFGVEGPIPRIRKYIDFVYVPAVKNASDEANEARSTAFARLIDRAVRAKLNVDERIAAIRESAKNEIENLSASHSRVLEDLSGRIGSEYRKFNQSESDIHLEWSEFDARSLQINLPPVHLELSDDLVRNPVTKFGHGTQRNYLIALLLVSATYDFTGLQKLILGCEEPELYQHPPQAKIFAKTLNDLTKNQTQVIITTHSPHFISAKTFENIRLIRRSPRERSRSYTWSVDENCEIIAKAKNEDPLSTKAARAALNQFLQPQLNEIFFSPAVIFVEGDEDRALIEKYFELTNKRQDLLALGGNIVPVGGKGNFINALAIAKGFKIPFFAVFDGDMNLTNQKDKDTNFKQNRLLLSLLQSELVEQDGHIPSDTLSENFCIWENSIQDSFRSAEWEAAKTTTVSEFGWTMKRLMKNAMVVEASLERFMTTCSAPHLESLTIAILRHFTPSKALPS